MKGEWNATKTEKVTDNEDLKREQWFAEALRSQLLSGLNYVSSKVPINPPQ